MSKDPVINPIPDKFGNVVKAVITPAKKPEAVPGQIPLPLPLVQYEFEKEIISQRIKDGYVNATAMCKAANRPWSRYWETTQAKDFAKALSAALGIPITELIQSVVGGTPQLQGTWVHPQVAIHLAQWLSPQFAVKVTQWVFDWMSGRVPGGNMPYH
jgi:hypothetical protein